jgi:alkylhydroperoxidase family enzyme
MPRIPYLGTNELPEAYRSLLNPQNPHLDSDEDESESDGGSWDDVKKTRNTHRVLAHNPEILDAYRRFGAAVWQESGLSARERELVILSVACTLDSAYEWHQHARIALTVGIPAEELQELSRGNTGTFDSNERALIEYTDNFVEGTVTDEIHNTFLDHFDESTLVGVTQLAGYYLEIDRMGRALDLDLEEEFIGWEPETP